MKYEYELKIHSVLDYDELANIMNKYGKQGSRVIKAEFIGDIFEKGLPKKRYVLYLEKKIK